MPYQFTTISNLFVKPLLRSPLHFTLSHHVTLIQFNGRESGKMVATPVEYRRQGDTLIVISRKGRAWWKNVQGGAPVTLRLCGRDVQAVAEVIMMDKGAKFQAVRWMYPWMAVEQIADILTDLVVVQIHLPQTAPVTA